MAKYKREGCQVIVLGKGNYYFTSYEGTVNFVDSIENGLFDYRPGIFISDNPICYMYAMRDEDLIENGIVFKEKRLKHGKKR